MLGFNEVHQANAGQLLPDAGNVDVDKVIADLKDKFGTSVVTLDDKEAMTEAIAETDEVLMEKFFSGGVSKRNWSTDIL